MNIEVHDTSGAEELAPMKPFLKPDWCQCENPEFLVYADDNACPCGLDKHHVHCKKCGSIMQVG